MDEGNGWMWQLMSAYKNGAISKGLLISICYSKNWICEFDDNGSVTITTNIKQGGL